MIRFGEMTQDELFVTADAARAGVRIDNQGASDPLVILKHVGPGNPDNEPLRRLRALITARRPWQPLLNIRV
jgi:hypothetical protein